jgi:hypothetical protein
MGLLFRKSGFGVAGGCGSDDRRVPVPGGDIRLLRSPDAKLPQCPPGVDGRGCRDGLAAGDLTFPGTAGPLASAYAAAVHQYRLFGLFYGHLHAFQLVCDEAGSDGGGAGRPIVGQGHARHAANCRVLPVRAPAFPVEAMEARDGAPKQNHDLMFCRVFIQFT